MSAQTTLNSDPSAMGGDTVRNDLSMALVKLYRELFGRGPVRITTHAFDAGYIAFLRDVLAPHERLLIRHGRADLVCKVRAAIRDAERQRLTAEVQRLTGRPVLHDSFQLQPERDLAIELFWLPTGSEDAPATLQRHTRSRRPAFGTAG